MRQSCKYRLYPNQAQQQRIEDTLEPCRRGYNRLLAERQEAYEKWGKILSYVAQANSFPARKEAIPAFHAVHAQGLQDVAKRLDQAFQAFLRRVKNGEKPGYPRFKSFGRYHSFTYPPGGYAMRDGRVHLSKIGAVKMKLHRPSEGPIKTCTIVTKNGRYYAVFSCEVEAVPVPLSQAMMGGDLGITHLLGTSDGEWFDHPQSLRQVERELKRWQRAVSRKQKGSWRRKQAVRQLAREHERVANQRRDTAHKVARHLVNTYDLIAVETPLFREEHRRCGMATTRAIRDGQGCQDRSSGGARGPAPYEPGLFDAALSVPQARSNAGGPHVAMPPLWNAA